MHLATQPIKFYNKMQFDKTALNPLLIPSSLAVYLKTTETCQLNCKHCFTNGINGKKIYFDPDATIDWFYRLHEQCKTFDSGMIIFHGGEPFLAPIEDMLKVYRSVSQLWSNLKWSCSTNLTYTLTDQHLAFFDEVFKTGFCTSWDKGIRFTNQKQEDLWRENLRILVDKGHNVTLNISLNKQLLDMDKFELVNWLNTLGVNYVQFERLTHDGSALVNTDIFPNNKDIDVWFAEMYEVYNTVKPKYNDVLLDGLTASVEKGIHGGVRCRDCEQKIFTINADGGISGCPNAAVDNSFSHISMSINEILSSSGRINTILCEIQRDARCYSCDVFDVCNSDCHQLQWQGDVCASPKTLMKKLKEDYANRW